MSPTPKRGSWLVTLPLVAGALAYMVFVFLPGRRTADELRSQIRDKANYLANAQSIGAALAASEEELRLARRYQDQWRRNTPRFTELSELYTKIHRIETESGIHSTRFDPQPAVTRERIAESPLLLGCTGGFASVFKLLHGLECLPEEIWVKRIRLEKMTTDSEVVQCAIDLVIFADNRGKTD